MDKGSTIQRDDRVEFVDVIKGFTIIVMVMYHLTGFYSGTSIIRDYCTPFFMALFFLMSGLFFSSKSTFAQYLLNKINRLIIPLLFFYCVNYLIFFTASDIIGLGDKGIIDKFHLSYFLDILSPKETFQHHSAQLWFLICLFHVSLIYYLINKLKNANLRLIASLLISAAGFFLAKKINLPYFIDSAMTMTFFFGLGHFLKGRDVVFKRQSYDYLVGIFAIVLFVTLVNYTGVYSWVMENEYQGNFILFLLGAILGISGIFFLSRWIGDIKILNFYGKNGLIVLGTHQLVLIGVNIILKKTIGNLDSFMLLAINLVSTIIIEYFIIIVLSKLVPFFVGKKDLISKKNQHV